MSVWNLFPPARERWHARYHPRDIHAHVRVFSSLYYPWGNWKPGRSVLSGYSWAQFPYYDRNPKAYSQRPVIPYVQVGWRRVEKVEVPEHTVLFTFFYSPPCTVCFQDMEILKFFMPLSVGQTTKYSKTWSSNWISQYQIPRMDLCLPSNKLRWQTYSKIMKQVSSNRPWSSLKPLNGHMKVLSQLTHISK